MFTRMYSTKVLSGHTFSLFIMWPNHITAVISLANQPMKSMHPSMYLCCYSIQHLVYGQSYVGYQVSSLMSGSNPMGKNSSSRIHMKRE